MLGHSGYSSLPTALLRVVHLSAPYQPISPLNDRTEPSAKGI